MPIFLGKHSFEFTYLWFWFKAICDHRVFHDFEGLPKEKLEVSFNFTFFKIKNKDRNITWTVARSLQKKIGHFEITLKEK